MASIALVILDTVRHDVFTEEFGWLDGCWFEQAYSTSHWTIPAHGSLFSGFYPSESGIHAKSPSYDYSFSLPEELQNAGYTTRIFTENAQLHAYDGWGRGFDQRLTPTQLAPEADDLPDWGGLRGADGTISPIALGLWQSVFGSYNTLNALRYGYRTWRHSPVDGRGEEVLRRVDATSFGEDEFLLVNLMEAHGPWKPPDGDGDPVLVSLAEALDDAVTDTERVKQAYMNSAAALAELYQRLFAILQEDFDYVITLSDHGELLGEYGLWDHGFGVYPELVKIPLVVSGEDIEKNRVETPVNLLDIHATIAELTNVDTPSTGRDLTNKIKPVDLLTETHGLLPFHERDFERAGVNIDKYRELNDVFQGVVRSDGAYAYECPFNDLVVNGKVGPEQASNRLKTLRDELKVRDSDEDSKKISGSVMRQLEDLGYA